MNSSKKHKKMRRTSRVAPSVDSVRTVEFGDMNMKKLNNIDRSKSGQDSAKVLAADTVSVIQNVKKGVDKFKELHRTRRKCVIGSPSKSIRGLDGSVNDDPMNPRNRYLISYFSKLADSADISEEIDLEYVDQMLSSGASIHCIDRYGQTILHEVAREWEIDVAQFLLERGAEVNRGDCYGRTPLHVAAAVDYADMVNFLIENGADIECKTKEELQTPLHYAARNDACESLKTLHKLGANINQRDYKDRTPLQVAAELDRSETALILLELGAKASDVDKSGLTAMVLMICKMPSVAIEALNKFHRRDRANRKQYYDIHMLEPTKRGDREPRSRSVLQVVVEYNQLELIKHPVMLRLIDIKWKLCGRFGVLKQVIWNIFIILLWTILAVTMKSPITYDFSVPQDIFQFCVMISATICTFIQIFLEIREYLQSKKNFKNWQDWRVGELKKDLKFCHPRWPQERSYLEQEIDYIESKGPSYFSEFWNYLDWFVYVLLLAVSVCHITAWLTDSIVISDVTIRIFAVTIIFVWCRFMKVARAFRVIGPFIVMLGHITKDCARFLFLYMEFYIPYLCAFWMIFGGTDKETEVTGMTTFDDLAFSLFRITLVDDYDYDSMKEIDKIMANILLGSFLAISALVGINLFIALLSDTFQRVYDNAFSNAIMQQASIMQGIEEGLSTSKKQFVRGYVHTHCAPETLFYDDDNVTEDGNELKKVTFQIKDDLDNMREQYHGLDMDCKEVIAFIKGEVKKVKDKQTIAVSEITSELHLLKQLVQQLIDRPVVPDSSLYQYPSGNNGISRGQSSSNPASSLNDQQFPKTRATELLTVDSENKIYIQPHFANFQHNRLSGQQFPTSVIRNRSEEDLAVKKSIDERTFETQSVIPGAQEQLSKKKRLGLYREQRKKTLKKRQEQEDYLEQKSKSADKSVTQQTGLLPYPHLFSDMPSADKSVTQQTGLLPYPHSFSDMPSDDNEPVIHVFKFRPTTTPPAQMNIGQFEESNELIRTAIDDRNETIIDNEQSQPTTTVDATTKQSMDTSNVKKDILLAQSEISSSNDSHAECSESEGSVVAVVSQAPPDTSATSQC